jgi:hypothetical protein
VQCNYRCLPAASTQLLPDHTGPSALVVAYRR